MPKTKSPAPLAPTKHIVPYDNFGVRRGGGGVPPPSLWGRVPARASPRGWDTKKRGPHTHHSKEIINAGATAQVITEAVPQIACCSCNVLRSLHTPPPQPGAKLKARAGDGGGAWPVEAHRSLAHTSTCEGQGVMSHDQGFGDCLCPPQFRWGHVVTGNEGVPADGWPNKPTPRPSPFRGGGGGSVRRFPHADTRACSPRPASVQPFHRADTAHGQADPRKEVLQDNQQRVSCKGFWGLALWSGFTGAHERAHQSVPMSFFANFIPSAVAWA